MKRQILLSLTLSLLATSAFALPASEQPVLGEMKGSHQTELPTLVQDGKLVQQYQRVADNGPDRLVQQYQRVS